MGYSWHTEQHYSNRNNWLRAGVLGANDGLISVASLLMGLAAANPEWHTLLITGIAAIVGGAISMAAGEYVSVSSQADTEAADLKKEADELEKNPELELDELTKIYQDRGVDPKTARAVAEQLTANDALAAHARDELGISEVIETNALEAAGASALSFCGGAALPLIVILLFPQSLILWAIGISTLLGLALLGFLSAKLGGAPARPAVIRVVVWGIIALTVTGMIGKLFGVAA